MIDSQLMDKISQYNVVWTTPSKNENGSMPLGNGETGINLWVEPSGDIIFYISRTDSWDENERLCKLGRVRIKFLPPITLQTSLKTTLSRLRKNVIKFSQTLDLGKSEIIVKFNNSLVESTIKIWIHAEHQAIHIDFKSSKPQQPQIELEIWRNQTRSFKEAENHCISGFKDSQSIYPDTIVDTAQKIMWYHRNSISPWENTLKHQFLEDLIPELTDPLKNRIFGAQIQGFPSDNFLKIDSKTMKLNSPTTESHVIIFTHTEPNGTYESWERRLTELNSKYVDEVVKRGLEDVNWNHQDWWKEFWSRSYIFLSRSKNAFNITQSYILQRFMHAIGGRGNFPIKFNGSIFTVCSDSRYDPDYRRWGGGYWFQNTRLPYWGMLNTKDWEFFEPLFRMYMNTRKLGEWRSKKYYNHDGWFFPETMSFYGTYLNENFGWDWSHKKIGDPIENQYIRFHFNGALELLALAIVYYQYTEDRSFLKHYLIPFTEMVLVWWDKHWPVNSQGQLDMQPSQSLETYWNIRNPTPDIAGLLWTIKELLSFPEGTFDREQKQFMQNLLNKIPPIPRGPEKGVEVIYPSYEPLVKRTNSENPELYCVFPYRIFGIDKPELDIAKQTFYHRHSKQAKGWNQDDFQAACLGLSNDAKKLLEERCSNINKDSRFPVFWGPNFDWIPDQDHGSGILITLHHMLVQCDGDRIYLFPAWPKKWNAEFKLWVAKNTCIEGKLQDGKIVELNTTPSERRKDLIVSKFDV